MDSQFSVSVELSKVVPIVPIVNVASKSLLSLVRSFKKSGSDIVTEHDLASIFGRARIEDAFARTFRNAVRTSSIHKLAGIAELVLEAGAGPTVRNAVDKAPFFSMVVQLSALTWGHEIKSLAQSLIKIFTERHANDLGDVPTYADTLGTLRCIREQTCGFPWESKFQAIERVLVSDLGLSSEIDLRTSDEYVLAALLDALPAAQHWPEEHFIEIQTNQGLSTVVVWAHDLLGLTVNVLYGQKSRKFGHGKPNVSINWSPPHLGTGFDAYGVAVLNKTKDVVFQLKPSEPWQRNLWPSNRHPVLGFGFRYYRFPSGSVTQESENLQHFVASVIKTALSEAEQARSRIVPAVQHIKTGIPSKARILEVSHVIFPELPIEALSLLKDDDIMWSFNGNKDAFLVKLILALSMVTNLEECYEASFSMELHLQDDGTVWDFSYRMAFEFLARLLLGYRDPQVGSAAVLSSWGWSLVVHSVASTNSTLLEKKFALIKGVPSRNEERKSLITDTGSGIMPDERVNVKSPYQTIGRAGDTIVIESSPKGNSNYKHFIGVTDNAFIVQNHIHFQMQTSKDPDKILHLQIGFRGMQEVYWSSSHLPPCSCLNRFIPGQEIVVPDKTWVFRGFPRSLGYSAEGDEDPWELRTNPPARQHNVYARMARQGKSTEEKQEERRRRSEALPPRDKECRVHISSTTGDNALRWMMLADFFMHHPKVKEPRFQAWFLRKDDCCVECGIKYIKANLQGDNIEFCHAALIT